MLNFLKKIFYKKKKYIYNIIQYIIFTIRNISNVLKISFNVSTKNIYIPNLLIKNIIFINPKKIEYINSVPIKFYKNNHKFIENFNYEKTNKTIQQYKYKNYKFITCKEIFVDKINLKKCRTFLYFRKKISRFKIFKNCKNNKDIINFLKEKIILYENIKKNGIQKKLIDNLEFMIDSKKNLVKINSGNHRFIISRILKLSKIPIEVKIVHSDNFSKKLYKKVKISEVNKFIKTIEKKYA